MTYLLNLPADQRSFHKCIPWEKFKLIEQGFSESPGVKLFYYQGELEILAVSPEHEMFSGIIGMLLVLTRCVLQAQTSKVQAVKMLKQGIRQFPS